MFETLAIVLPIFLIIGLGFGTASTKLLGDRVTDGLSDFVFVIAIPILLFRTLATAPLPAVQPWFYWLAYFSALAIVWVLTTVIAGKVFGLTGQELPIAGFTAVQSNTVFIGIPLVLRAFGDDGAVPLFLLIAIHLPITMTVATLLVEKADGQSGRWAAMLKKLVLHPILIGIFAGIAFRITGLALPASVATATKMMADAAAPTALFALGMTLKRYGTGAPLPLVGSLSVLKLLVHPALVYLLAFHVLPMPPVWAAVAVLFAACPSGVNAYLMAQRYQVGVALSSSTIAVSTLFALITTTGWVWLVSGVK
jgi:malonate transporter and related proteins